MQTQPAKPNLILLLILALLVIFCPMGIDIYLPAFPTIAEQFSVSEKQVQQTVAIFMLTGGLGQLIAGPLADRFGRKPLTQDYLVTDQAGLRWCRHDQYSHGLQHTGHIAKSGTDLLQLLNHMGCQSIVVTDILVENCGLI